jgi:hypothetical protein
MTIIVLAKKICLDLIFSCRSNSNSLRIDPRSAGISPWRPNRNVPHIYLISGVSWFKRPIQGNSHRKNKYGNMSLLQSSNSKAHFGCVSMMARFTFVISLLSLLSSSIYPANAQSVSTNATQWPLHDDGLNKVVQWDHYSFKVNGERLFLFGGEVCFPSWVTIWEDIWHE